MKLNALLIKGSKAPAWLWIIWLASVTTTFSATKLSLGSFDSWTQAASIITAIACTVIIKVRYDKEDRLADWIDSKFRKMFRRS